MKPLASFSCLDRRGGGGGERKNTSLSTRGGSFGLSRVVVEGMHQILILTCYSFYVRSISKPQFMRLWDLFLKTSNSSMMVGLVSSIYFGEIDEEFMVDVDDDVEDDFVKTSLSLQKFTTKALPIFQ